LIGRCPLREGFVPMEVLTGRGGGTHRKRATRPSTVMQTLRMTSEKAPEARIPASHVGILETALLAIVSTISHRDGMISSNPVGFDWDGEHVRLSTLKSRVKYHNLQANPQITLCVVDPKVPTLPRDPRICGTGRRPGEHLEQEAVRPNERHGNATGSRPAWR
jgi:hypothetical protein